MLAAGDYAYWLKTNINGAQGYTDWLNNFGESQPGAGGGGAAGVPEPGSMALVFVGLVAAAVRRGNRK